ncbi:hypothetical protein [Luteimonas salinilitoris]|uniref:Fap n=1 Tax=Luteimonas salinilitoris TaxID=3237697 RepID=A0ABV4HN20_9GAMM
MNRPIHISALCLLCMAPGAAEAAGARNGVEPRHGEMVLLRDVNARHAVRPAPPSMAVIADPAPNREIDRSLGTGELSDADFAAIDSGNRLQPGTGGAAVGQIAATAVAGSLGPASPERGGLISGAGINGALSAPLGAVGTGTRGIGRHIDGALSQFPLGNLPGNGNGGR